MLNPPRHQIPAKIATCLFVMLVGLSSISVTARAADTLRIGVLKFGTVNWELQTIRQLGLDTANGFELEVVPLAAKNATHVAIQGGAVDMIVSDWIWVSRQRANGSDYTFVPYSTAAGAIMVRPDSGIERVEDLAGRKIGVAGGPVDKSWLLLSAYTRKHLNKPVEELASPVYAAPPLINELIQRGEFPAALNYWHYSARLEALGMKSILRVKDILPELSIEREIPLIGWVFSEAWAKNNQLTVNGFLRASEQVRQVMKTDDTIWESLRPMMKADDERMEISLRDAYRDGIPGCFDRNAVIAIERAFDIVAELGGSQLVGSGSSLSPGTIYPPAISTSCP